MEDRQPAETETATAREGEREEEREVRKEWESPLMDMEKRLTDKIKEVEERNGAPEANLAPPLRRGNGGEERGRSQGGERGPEGGRGQPCVLLVDSNGRGVTEDTVKNHIPAWRRGKFTIRKETTYTMEEAYHRVGRGEVDVRGAVVVVDCLTNNVRGTRQRTAASPDELVYLTDQLRQRILAAGAAKVIICELKPMQCVDVSPYNRALHYYLLSQGDHGYGCMTQIRLEYLANDGYHVISEFGSVIDKTYACAIMGVPPPCPTPREEFVPGHIRRRRDIEWPRLPGGGNTQRGFRAEGQSHIHGWQ